MDVVFIDQNKWIDLAGIEAGKISSKVLPEVYKQLRRAVDQKRVVFPLTVSHILETSKRNDPRSRLHVAIAQARLSKGYVFRSRKARLLLEMKIALQGVFGEQPLTLPDNWAIVPGFMQAFDQFDEMVAFPAEAERTRSLNSHSDPREQLLGYMKNQDDNIRRTAHAAFASESEALVGRIEERRRLLTGQSVDLRRRTYAATLFMDHQSYVADVLKSIGHTVEEMTSLGKQAFISFLQNVPTLNIEAEIAARLEAQNGNIKQNDIRDMHSFCTALPYSTKMITEKAFLSLAKQSKLDTQYSTSLSPSLEDLLDTYT